MRSGVSALHGGSHPHPPVVSGDGRRALATVMVLNLSHLQINILKWPMCKGAGPTEAFEATAFYVCRSHRNGPKERRAAGEFATHPPGSLALAGDSCAQPQWSARRDFFLRQFSSDHPTARMKISQARDIGPQAAAKTLRSRGNYQWKALSWRLPTIFPANYFPENNYTVIARCSMRRPQRLRG